jgi:hypothetical protein
MAISGFASLLKSPTASEVTCCGTEKGLPGDGVNCALRRPDNPSRTAANEATRVINTMCTRESGHIDTRFPQTNWYCRVKPYLFQVNNTRSNHVGGAHLAEAEEIYKALRWIRETVLMDKNRRQLADPVTLWPEQPPGTWPTQLQETTAFTRMLCSMRSASAHGTHQKTIQRTRTNTGR